MHTKYYVDLLAVIWLETHLQKWKGTLLVVSHDQDFLNSVCTDVIHIYQNKLEYYKGNYDGFKKSFTDAVALKRKEYEKAKKAYEQAKIQKKKKDTKKAVEKVSRETKQPKGKPTAKQQREDAEAESKLAELAPPPRVCIVQFLIFS